MNADPYVISYFVVLKRGTTDDVLLASSALLLTAGLFIILVGILGCCGTMKHNVTMLKWVSNKHDSRYSEIFYIFEKIAGN